MNRTLVDSCCLSCLNLKSKECDALVQRDPEEIVFSWCFKSRGREDGYHGIPK